ncbi:WXG100 family type VII secretion target [Streptomyces sp. WZ-12]|uniref:WXG100 family type VII secretion target n=1 Tax=Streptomyces sp. WZ-12 TaxID=3030210 RepID=UPI0023810203|nr:WXG100 family type VII secretion target [Streptomyces sp. WZ-12]
MTASRRNPHALHEAAAGWRDMGKHLDGLVRDLDRHVGTAAAADWHGPAGEAFAAEWHQLKRSVDDSLPAFELAAADLDSAAAPHHTDGADDSHDTASTGAAQQGGGQSSGPQVAYGFMALGQLANGLGGALGKRGRGGGGGGQSQAPQLRHQWESSSAAHGPDPFGTPRDGDAATRGGEGLAKGVRTNPAEAQREAEQQEAKAAAQQQKAGEKTGEKPAEGKRAPATDEAGGQSAAEPADKANDKTPGPDVTQHGAFG